MELKMVSTSVVVLSEGNNPRLLNPDFLERNSVVPPEWKVKDVVVTPPFSRVIYENGVQFTVEINKLQIQFNKPDVVDWEKMLPSLAAGYLDLLPHVTYGATGINFVFKALRYPGRPYARLLENGPWLDAAGGLTGAAVELQYWSTLPHMNVKVGLQGTPESGGGAGEALVFTVNYHHNFDVGDSDGRVALIRRIGPLAAAFLDFAKTLPFD